MVFIISYSTHEESHFYMGHFSYSLTSDALIQPPTRPPAKMEDDDYEEILGVRVSQEVTGGTISYVHCLFRFYDYTLRLIVAEYDWSAGSAGTGGWGGATEYQMNHPIYLYDTTVMVTPLTMTGTLDASNYQNTVSPWKDFWIITFRSDKELDGSATTDYIAL